MARRYKLSLLKKIKAGEEIVDYKGVPILVKPIPEGGQSGDMDPRVYKSMRMMPLLSRFLPKPKKNATLIEKIMPLRKMFNTYKGDVIVSTGVDIRYITVEGDDGYGIPVRIYKRTNSGEHLPMFVYYHGGGFFGGSVDIVEQMCQVLVENLDCIVLNVDYRLCPEAHYPQPLDDCWSATKWAYEHAEELGGDPARLSVGGDSAGGNLAAAITLRDREEKTGMVRLQVLLYPAVNISRKETEFYHGMNMDQYKRSPRHTKVLNCVLPLMAKLMNGEENMLEDVYLQGHISSDNIYASPLLDDFHDLPATLLVFGEHDMLVFEDFAYAQTAQKAGVPLKTIVYRGMGHGFADQIGVAPQAEDCMKEIARAIQDL